jgi:putative endonuclease
VSQEREGREEREASVGADPRQELGAEGEEAACGLLRESGYRILERNYRTRLGELDAVAFEGGELVFVEVRSRSTDGFGSGAESVGPRKQKQLVKMAQVYIQDKRVGYQQPCRFDVVEMQARASGEWNSRLIRDAFSAE